MAPHTDVDLHQQVSVAELLVLGGLADSQHKAWASISHGRVAIEQWTISLGEGTLPRWVLRGVTITSGDRSITISEDGTRIKRKTSQTLEHA